MSDDTTSPSSETSVDSNSIISNGKRKKSLRVILIVFAVAALAGLAWWLYASRFEATDNAMLEAHVHPVSARIEGTIQQVLMDDNEVVKKGQLLAVIDPGDYEIALKKAQATLESAKAQVAMASKSIPWNQQQANAQVLQAQGNIGASKSEITQAHAAVDEAKNMLAQKEADYQNALSDYQRLISVDPDAISAQQLDAARTKMLSAKAARDAAQDALSRATAAIDDRVSKLTQSKGIYQAAQSQEIQVEIAKQNFENAQATLDEVKAAYDQAKLNLSYTKIYAPVDGRIGKKNIETGQRVQAGEPLMAVVQPDVWVVANYKETQLKHMRPGQAVDISVDAFPDQHFKGHVDSFSPATGAEFALLPPENATGNFTKIVQRVPVKIMLNQGAAKGYENLLAPGMSVIVKVYTDGSERRVAHDNQ